MAYCFTCGAWADLCPVTAMCRPCIDAWHPARTSLDPARSYDDGHG